METNKFELATAEENKYLAEIFETKAVNETNSRIRHTTTTDNKLLFNALSGKSEPIKRYLGETVEVTDIVVTGSDVAEIVGDASSDKVNKPVVHFFCSDGKHLSTLSNGIVKNVRDLLSCGMIPTVECPLRIRFEEVETPKGTAHIFDLV